MFRHEQLASLCGPGLAVATIAFLFPHHTNAQSEMPVNKDYFEAAAQDVFGDAFTGLHDAPYAEIKSEYSSDYRGIAQIPLKGLEHMAFQPTNETTLRDYELLYADFPSVVTQDLGMPDGLLVLSLPSRPGDVFLYRFSQTATALLLIQDY